MKLFDEQKTPARDQYGHYCHPDLDQFFDGDEGPLRRDDLSAAGFESWSLYLYNDHTPAASGINDACCEGNPDVSAWNPGREGWRRVGIWDTEDGPIAVFVRAKENGA